MRQIAFTNQFKRDAKKNYLMLVTPEWAEVLHCLHNEQRLPAKYCDHSLSGAYSGLRDCHIKPDFVLIYRERKEDNLIELLRLGSHSDLDL